MSPAPHRQPLLLTYGFRPFFLLAGIYAVVAIAAWLAWLGLHAANVVATRPTIAEPPHLWHGHEMLFGYAAAVVSGFLLTAVPNWTGAAPSPGRASGCWWRHGWPGGRSCGPRPTCRRRWWR